jgi:hypothetical protein
VGLGGSDAHTTSRIASVYTAAPGATKHEFLDSLRRGTCSIGGDCPGLAALIRDVYLVVGRHYANLLDPSRPWTSRRIKSTAASAALLPAALGGVPAVLTLLQAARQEWIAQRALTHLAGLDENARARCREARS